MSDKVEKPTRVKKCFNYVQNGQKSTVENLQKEIGKLQNLLEPLLPLLKEGEYEKVKKKIKNLFDKTDTILDQNAHIKELIDSSLIYIVKGKEHVFERWIKEQEKEEKEGILDELS